METGKVKFFNPEKGFGFISRNRDNDLFVHITALSKGVTLLAEGQEVGFDVVKKKDGRLQAANVSMVGPTLTSAVPANANPKQTTAPAHTTESNIKSPYDFNERNPDKSKKSEPKQFHDLLNDANYDIAFDIKWTTLTPTAANPCTAPQDVPDNAFNEIQDGYKGYNKRWLMIGNRLAISPFTVKSAIANGFSNLLGSCYRVMPEDRIERHKNDLKQGQYPYTGAYKRYRVARSNMSKPGIIKSITDLPNGDKKVGVILVKEYYFNGELREQFEKEQAVHVEFDINANNNRKNKPPVVKLADPPGKNVITVKYYGKYCDGMNASKNHNKHTHRFYTEEKDEKGVEKETSGIIKAVNFKTEKKLQDIVHIGGKDPNDRPIPLWYENLETMKEKDFIYYEEFNGCVTNIGKCFQFKALFLHKDTVPEGQEACDKLDKLCPRCNMFGMTVKGKNEDSPQGFRGRFKAVTLVSNKRLKLTPGEKCSVPVFKDGNFVTESVDITAYVDEKNKTVCRQYLLPIQGQPKPNKRDIHAYYNNKTGKIEGAKYYLHAMLDIEKLESETNGKQDLNDRYSHQLRNFSEVVLPEEQFSGTVGAENCTSDEIAALLILLHSPIAKHGFKIGLGKAFGMGSVESRINKVWIRKKGTYEKWVHIEGLTELDNNELPEKLKEHNNVIDIVKKVDDLKKVINCMAGMEDRKLAYPPPGGRYWTDFNNRKL